MLFMVNMTHTIKQSLHTQIRRMLTLQRTPLMSSIQFLRHLTAVRHKDYRMWSLLPVEILIRVFCALDSLDLLRCGQVCISWRRIASDESLWAHLFLQERRLWSVASGLPIEKATIEMLAQQNPGHLGHRGATQQGVIDETGTYETRPQPNSRNAVSDVRMAVRSPSVADRRTRSALGNEAQDAENMHSEQAYTDYVSLINPNRLIRWGIMAVQAALCGIDEHLVTYPRRVRHSGPLFTDQSSWRSLCLHHHISSSQAQFHITYMQPWWAQLQMSHVCFDLRRNQRRVLVIGASESKKTFQLLWDEHSPFRLRDLGPGHATGLGSGLCFRSNNLELVMLSCYATQVLKRNTEAWNQLCQGVNGLIVIFDAMSDIHAQVQQELQTAYESLPKGIPALHIAITNRADSLACDIADSYQLYGLNFYWRLYTCDTESLANPHLENALHWFSDAIVDFCDAC